MKQTILIILLALIIIITGCAIGNVIKSRLRPPHEIEIEKYRDILDERMMSEISSERKIHYILFQYENKAANHVNLAGNFNGWAGTKEYDRFDPSIGIMHDNDGDGIWETVAPLPAGRYQYKFVIDHGASWVLDPNHPLKDLEDGIENSLIIIDE